MLALQAGVVAAPRAAPRMRSAASGFAGWGWALVPIASIVGVIFAIRYVSDTATWLTYLALIAVPPLAAVALGWAMRGATPLAALGAVPLFALAWAAKDSLVGEAAAALLSALSCVTLGVLLAAVTPPGWLKVGILLMAGADVWLVASDLLQTPNAALVAAQPAGGPAAASDRDLRLGHDGLRGPVRGRRCSGRCWPPGAPLQLSGALLTLGFAGVFDLLFFVVAELPATVPVALALIVARGLGAARRGSWVSAFRRRSKPAAATPRRAT